MSVALAAMHNTTDKKLRDSATRIFGHRAQGSHCEFTLTYFVTCEERSCFEMLRNGFSKAQALGPRSRQFLIYPNLTSDSCAVEEPSLHQFLQDS